MPQQRVLTVDEQKLNDVWNEHLRAEFNAHPTVGFIHLLCPAGKAVFHHQLSENTWSDKLNTPRTSVK